MSDPADPRPPAAGMSRTAVWMAAGALVLVGAMAWLGYRAAEGPRRAGAPPEPPPAASAARPALVPPAPRRLKLPPDADELQRRRLAARASYDFGAFADWVAGQEDLRSVQGAQVDAAALPRARRDDVVAAGRAWPAATPEDPIVLAPGAAAASRIGAAWGEDGKVLLRRPDTVVRSSWPDVPPRIVLALLEAATRADAPGGAELLRRRAWARAFAEEYNLPLISPTAPRT